MSEPNIDVCYNSKMFVVIGWLSEKCYTDRMVGSADNFVTFLIRWTWNSINKRLWQLLDKKNIELFFVF